MNKIIFLFAGLIIVSIFTSCEKKLNITPEGTPQAGFFWRSEADAISAANGLYDEFGLYTGGRGEEFYGRGFMWFIATSDDMTTGRSSGEPNNIVTFNRNYIGGSKMEQQWQTRYITIKRANDVILNVPKINMDQKLKNRILGEAYFLSGLMYFQLASNYGDDKMGVPIVKRDQPDVLQPRAKNVTENYNYILSELSTAASLLPYFDQLAPADYGRAHKTAAWAHMAKTYLYMKDWPNAEKYADSVINSGKHALLPEYKDVFKIANNWSKEYIWSAVSNAQGTWGSILPGVMLQKGGWGEYNGWGYFAPTKELFDAFQPGDKRRSVTILAPGDHFMFLGKERIYDDANSPSSMDTKYQFNKYMEPYASADKSHLSPSADAPTTDLNVPLMRYAEVILIRAEAKLMQGKNADADINAIRNRAGLPSITNATMDNLKLERRCELAGEWPDRHRDLVRWGDAKAAYNKPSNSAYGNVVRAARMNFDPAKHNVWAVPQVEIDRGEGLVLQNDGWK